MRTTHFYGAKGGVGTSTVVAVVAVGFANTGRLVGVVDPSGDIAAMLDGGRIGVTIASSVAELVAAGPCDEILDDHQQPPGPHEHGRRVLVTANCWLAVRRASEFPVRPDGLIVVRDSQRSLRDHHVAMFLGMSPERCETVRRDPLVAQAVDAGDLGYRMPRGMQRHRLHDFVSGLDPQHGDALLAAALLER